MKKSILQSVPFNLSFLGSKKLENSFLTILGQYPIINYLEKLHIGKNNNFTEEGK